jgi:hypothetical protein
MERGRVFFAVWTELLNIIIIIIIIRWASCFKGLVSFLISRSFGWLVTQAVA